MPDLNQQLTELSVYPQLTKAGLYTVNQLCAHTEEEIAQIYQIDFAGIDEIKVWLTNKTLCLESEFARSLQGHWFQGKVVQLSREKDFGYFIPWRLDEKGLSIPIRYPNKIVVDRVYFRNTSLKLDLNHFAIFQVEHAPAWEQNKYKNPDLVQAVQASITKIDDLKKQLVKKFKDKNLELPDGQMSDDFWRALPAQFYCFYPHWLATTDYVTKMENSFKYKHEQLQNRLNAETESIETKIQAKQEEFEVKLQTIQTLDAEIQAKLAQLANFQEQELFFEQQKREHEQHLSRQTQYLSERLWRWGLQERLEAESDTEPLAAHITEENEIIPHLKAYAQAKGFVFSEDTLINFYTCLKTRSLTILAGLSGTGKSSLVKLFAEAFNARHVLIPVKPTWTDDHDLLGFYHPERKEYFPTPLMNAIVEAQANPDQLWLICLDEMNLARVESYMASLLSVREQQDPHLELYSKSEQLAREALFARRQADYQQGLITEKEFHEYERQYQTFPYRILIPANLHLIGTVNIDETTKPFSDKVLDRAQIIHFDRISSFSLPEKSQELLPARFLSSSLLQIFSQTERYQNAEIEASLKRFNDSLETVGFHFAHRVSKQMRLYCALAQKLSPRESGVWLDYQVEQKLLPRIKGFGRQRLRPFLQHLAKLCAAENCLRSQERVQKMLAMLEHEDQVNYWELFRYVPSAP